MAIHLSLRAQLALFLALYLFRVVNSHLLQTFFQPDEFFQSLEPAWQWAFGKTSGAWITWEWKESLRSSLHPLLFSSAYQIADKACTILGITGGRRADVLIATPRLVQALFAALMDLSTFRLAARVYSPSTSIPWVALGLTIVSPWQWFCSVRTFSNSIEASLTAVALDCFPWQWFLTPTPAPPTEQDDSTAYGYLQVSLILAAIACVLRPTNVLIWLSISTCLALRRGALNKTFVLVECAVLSGGAVLAVTAAMDRMFFGEWVLPALRFLYFNLVQSLAVFYGRNRVDYYLTEGLPLLLTTALPFGLIGMWQAVRNQLRANAAGPATAGLAHTTELRYILALAVLFPIIALTTIAHKEVRFIYPLLPILHVLAAGPTKRFLVPSRFAAAKRRVPLLGANVRWFLLAVLLGANVLIAGYVSRVHQRGVMDVVQWLREKQDLRIELRTKYNMTASAHTPEQKDMTAAFLMPCHSTPWRSHLFHASIDAWALTCEPPLDVKPAHRAGYMDEADQFYADPRVWIDTHMRHRYTIAETVDPDVTWDQMVARKQRKWPEYLIFFQHLESTMQTVLNGSTYRECKRFFNTDWIDDGRREGDVIVYCLKTSNT